jgi:hypothetical protein
MYLVITEQLPIQRAADDMNHEDRKQNADLFPETWTCNFGTIPKVSSPRSATILQTSYNSSVRYFHMECHYLDFGGKIFGQAATQIGIARFRGIKRIDLLEPFPLEYHPSKTEITTRLGRKFISLIGKHHHRHYQGVAFIMQHGQAIRIPVHSRIILPIPD